MPRDRERTRIRGWKEDTGADRAFGRWASPKWPMKKRLHGAAVPLIAVHRKSEKPLHRQIYDALRAMILERRLLPDQQIPSTRALADELRRGRPWSLSRHCCSELKIGLIAAAQKLCPQCVNWGTSSGRRISLEL